MTQMTFDAVEVGYELPTVSKPAITRTTLALFAGASNDHNPIHIDIDVAKKAGMDDVFAQGMLSMAYLGQVLTNWVSQTSLRSYRVRFGAITNLGDKINCNGKIVEKFSHDEEQRVRVEIQAANQNGEVKLIGEAVIALP